MSDALLARGAKLFGVRESAVLKVVVRDPDSAEGGSIVVLLKDGRKEVFAPEHIAAIESGQRLPFLDEKRSREPASAPVLPPGAPESLADASPRRRRPGRK